MRAERRRPRSWSREKLCLQRKKRDVSKEDLSEKSRAVVTYHTEREVELTATTRQRRRAD